MNKKRIDFTLKYHILPNIFRCYSNNNVFSFDFLGSVSSAMLLGVKFDEDIIISKATNFFNARLLKACTAHINQEVINIFFLLRDKGIFISLIYTFRMHHGWMDDEVQRTLFKIKNENQNLQQFSKVKWVKVSTYLVQCQLFVKKLEWTNRNANYLYLFVKWSAFYRWK